MCPEPNFTKVNCTAKLFVMYAAERTETDQDFVFTAYQIGDVFGCTEQSAMLIIHRNESFGTFIRADRKDKIVPYIFKITKKGIEYAKYLKEEENRKLSMETLRQ